MKEVFSGICTALVTPFREGKVDYSALEKLVDYQLSGGIKAISILGTTGEPCTLTSEEKREIIKFCHKKIGGRAKLIVGTGSNNTSLAVKESEFASGYADALLVVTPYYNKCTQHGLEEYYKSIASLGCPIIIYNVPSRTGVNISPSALEGLAKIDNVCGFKQASENISETLQILTDQRKNMAIYSGEDKQNYLFYALGGRGAISVTANAFPALVQRVYDNYQSKKIEQSLALQERLSKINSLLFCQVNPIPIKYCLSKLGLCKNELRSPLTPMASNAEIDSELDRLREEYNLKNLL